MKRNYAGVVIAAVVAFGVGTWIAPVNAAPPVATPSPGYEARLQEQRARTYYVVRTPKPLTRRHVKRIHDGTR
jgi:hypothetical protein